MQLQNSKERLKNSRTAAAAAATIMIKFFRDGNHTLHTQGACCWWMMDDEEISLFSAVDREYCPYRRLSDVCILTI